MAKLQLLAGFLALLSAPVAAQAPQSATVPKQAVVSEYAACVLERSPERVRELLATEVGSTQERTIAKSLMTNMTSCANGRMFISMRTGEARGALSEAVLKSDAALGQSAQMLVGEAAVRPTETAGRKFVMAYARCLVSAAPDKARALIGTGYGSAEEEAAMMGFETSLKDCMPTGLAYQIDIPDVRNHVATALYDRAITSPGSGD